jgi:hypothetical protein
MRPILMLVPLLLCAAPAGAQAPQAPQPPALPPQLLDPATADRLADSMQAVSKALLDMRVGGIEAALEGREASPAERRMTVRDLGRRDDPDFDRHLEQRIAAAKPAMEHGVRVLSQTLPEVTDDLERARQAIERAMANMPDPNYPRR